MVVVPHETFERARFGKLASSVEEVAAALHELYDAAARGDVQIVARDPAHFNSAAWLIRAGKALGADMKARPLPPHVLPLDGPGRLVMRSDMGIARRRRHLGALLAYLLIIAAGVAAWFLL